jgi:hypothetical protein
MFFVFDVESVGLYGEGFAVGFVVAERDGTIRRYGRIGCNPMQANGNVNDRIWAQKNVLEYVWDGSLKDFDFVEYCDNPEDVRSAFWREWTQAKMEHYRDIIMVADCIYPVETNFIAQCIRDNPQERMKDAPYPLLDLSGVLLAAGINPTQTFDRANSWECAVHDPLADAHQSARILCEVLRTLDAQRTALGIPNDGEDNTVSVRSSDTVGHSGDMVQQANDKETTGV